MVKSLMETDTGCTLQSRKIGRGPIRSLRTFHKEGARRGLAVAAQANRVRSGGCNSLPPRLNVTARSFQCFLAQDGPVTARYDDYGRGLGTINLENGHITPSLTCRQLITSQLSSLNSQAHPRLLPSFELKELLESWVPLNAS